uniref:mRNA guanylyltransferase n=1 Tax=Kalanchoe fedtschenkoi TaxID=63787 RepID=A0A7N0TN11_KALFE
MDLNASPQPDDDDDEVFDRHYAEESYVPSEERVESAVEILNREREERRQRMKRERPDDRSSQLSQHSTRDHLLEMKSYRTYDKNKLPQGWLDCPAAGHEINGIIPSKVPLGESFNSYIPPGKRYSSKQVIHQQRVLGRTLGLVIDLTNTTRYYNSAEWKNAGIKYVKIQCRGRDVVPDNESVNTFVHEVSLFLSRQKQQHTKKCIFVHCTHGHNRTGFMIVHYLMRSQLLSLTEGKLQVASVTEAIQAFANARPPGIYKPDYIDALYTFYHEKKPEVVICPSTPEWKKSSEFDLNGEAIPDEDDDGGPGAPLQEIPEIDVTMTNDDVLGDAIPYDQQEAFRQFCYQALKLQSGPRGNSHFPGSHPVSLSRDNLQLLRQRYYYATWKADGTRYMMLLTVDGCYLIDRNFTFRRVQMRFPCKSTNGSAPEYLHHFTLLDGEMIIDTVPDSQKQERRYLIYDLIAINQISLVERPFSERWRLLEEEVIEPRNLERRNIFKSKNPNYRYDLEPFRVRRKDFYLLSAVKKVLRKFIPQLSHAADGLIFQGWDDPYVPRTHEGLLKWKYPEMNSVDFLFEMGPDERQQLYVSERGKKKLMEAYRVEFGEGSDPASYSGKIIECSYNSDKNVWVCMRVRVDKSTPNDINTYRKIGFEQIQYMLKMSADDE